MPPKKEPSKADIVFNQANVALARHQRLVAAMLAGSSTADLKPPKSEEELEREESDMFLPVPETAGLGATITDTDDFLPNRRKLLSDDKLLQQLLGKKAAKERAAKAELSATAGQGTQKPALNNKQVKITQEDSEDEGSGRASMFSSRKKEHTTSGQDSVAADVDTDGDQSDAERPVKRIKNPVSPSNQKSAGKSGKKRSTSYLDDLLASRSKKKKATKNS